MCAVAGVHVFFALATPFCGSFLHDYFGLLCHQLPQRSFGVAGMKFEVCARCIGFYLGIVTGSILRNCCRPVSGGAIVLFHCSFLIAAFSIGLKLAGVDSANGMRFFYGLCLGLSALRASEVISGKIILFLTTAPIVLDRKLSETRLGKGKSHAHAGHEH